jgi:hypothetical protein
LVTENVEKQRRGICVCWRRAKGKDPAVCDNKPAWSVVIADGYLPDLEVHSATEDVSVLSADVVKTNDLLGQLDVIAKITWSAEICQDVDDVLLLAQELLGKSLAALLALLLSSQLDYLSTLLTIFFG